MKDPITGELHVDKETIKKTTLSYCKNNLQGNTPDETVKELVKQRKIQQLRKMKEEEEALEIEYEDFEDVLGKFKRKLPTRMTSL